MFCNKCKHKLPDDSVFCQHCGNKIAKFVNAVSETTVDEELIDPIKILVQNAVELTEANRNTQPDNESDADFGLVPEKPIFTLGVMSVKGEKEYLNQLYTTNGVKIQYNRRGSMSVKGINGMVDIYETFLPSGQPYKTIYINMYGAKKSNKAPAGFYLNNIPTQTQPAPKKEKPIKIKYCSRCGSMIDNNTKICTGCGKQYFRGFRLTISSVSIIALALVAVILTTVCIIQHNEMQLLEEKIQDNKKLVKFVNNNVVFIEDDNTKLYHKYGCSKFKGDYFWVLDIDTAKGKGFKPCSKCH